MTTGGTLEQGRTAFAQRSWGDAYARLAAAAADTALELDDLERLALAAYLTGNHDASAGAWMRAHREAIRCNDPRRAARNALLIGSDLMFRGEIAPAMGWFKRVGRVLEGCDEGAEHAWLLTWNAFAQMWGGDPAGAEPAFARSVAVGHDFGDSDLSTMSRLGLGMCLVMQGQGSAGITLLDEVMVGVTSGEVSPMFGRNRVLLRHRGLLRGLRSASRQRMDRGAHTSVRLPAPRHVSRKLFGPSVRDHAAAGRFSDALAAAEQACDHLSGPVKWDSLGSAYYQLGELQRLRGEFARAEESYRRAAEAGRQPEPGLALLRLAQGHVDVAASMVRRALEEIEDPPSRSRMLPAYVDIMIAIDDVPSARAGADELAQIAEFLEARYLHAVAASAAGAVLLAEGDARSALSRLRSAGSAWRELDAPHETARVCVLIGLACRALDDPETSTMELDGARTIFEQLGAGPDIERLEALIRADGRARGGLTAREVEVLRLVASGKTNRAVASVLGLSEKTVARHISNILTKIGAPSRAAATAYAYEHRLI